MTAQINDRLRRERKCGPNPGDVEEIGAVVVDTFFEDDDRDPEDVPWWSPRDPQATIFLQLDDGTVEAVRP